MYVVCGDVGMCRGMYVYVSVCVYVIVYVVCWECVCVDVRGLCGDVCVFELCECVLVCECV